MASDEKVLLVWRGDRFLLKVHLYGGFENIEPFSCLFYWLIDHFSLSEQCRRHHWLRLPTSVGQCWCLLHVLNASRKYLRGKRQNRFAQIDFRVGGVTKRRGRHVPFKWKPAFSHSLLLSLHPSIFNAAIVMSAKYLQLSPLALVSFVDGREQNTPAFFRYRVFFSFLRAFSFLYSFRS